MARGSSLSSLAKRDRPQASLPTARRLLAYLRPYRRSVALAVVWIALTAINQAVAPALTGWIVDAALAARAAGTGTGSGTGSSAATPDTWAAPMEVPYR